MEKQEIKSKWDDLARQIGAELSPEALQRAETHAAATESDSQSTSSNPPVRTTLPKKPAADWVGLAGELGLPPIEDEPIPAETPAPKPPRREEVRESHSRESQGPESQVRQPQSRDSRQRDREQHDQSSRESRGPRRGRRGGRGRGDRRDQERDAVESTGQRHEHRGQRRDREEERRDSREHGRGRSDRRRETREPRREQPTPQDRDSDKFAEPVDEPSPVEESSSPPADQDSPTKSPAVSLWHKIFGAPAEPAAKTVEVSEGEVSETAEVQLSYESGDEFGHGEIRSLSGEDVTAAEFVEEVVERPAPSEDDTLATDRKRGRSRRRRRGGRGRRSRGGEREGRSAEPRIHESGGDDQLDADFDDLSDDDSDLTDEVSPAAPQPDHGDSHLDDSEGEQASPSSRSLSAAQRAIPSWDDAIGFIVDSNMQNRSQRRPPSRSDSRGGSPRGRSHGRRK